MCGGVCECTCVYVCVCVCVCVCLSLFPRRCYDNIHNFHGQLIVHFHTLFFSRDVTSLFLFFTNTYPTFMFFKDEIFLCWFSRMFFFIVDKFGLSVALIVTGHFRMFPKTGVYFIPHLMSSTEV